MMLCDACEMRVGAPDEGGMRLCVVCADSLSHATGLDMPMPDLGALIGPPPLTVYRWATSRGDQARPRKTSSSGEAGRGIQDLLPYLPPYGPAAAASHALDPIGAAADVGRRAEDAFDLAKIGVIAGSVVVIGLVAHALTKKRSRAENFG